MGGYLIEEILDGKGNIDTKVVVLMQNDLKGIAPKFLTNSLGCEKIEEWIESLFNEARQLMSI